MKKHIVFPIAIVIVLLLVVAGQIYISRQANVPLPQSKVQELVPPSGSSPTIIPTAVAKNTVVIDFGNGTKWSEKSSGANVYEATLNVVKAKGVTIADKQYKYGKMIERIGDVSNSKTSYWSYLVNGKPGTIAADRQIIYPGDKIEWKYVKQ